MRRPLRAPARLVICWPPRAACLPADEPRLTQMNSHQGGAGGQVRCDRHRDGPGRGGRRGAAAGGRAAGRGHRAGADRRGVRLLGVHPVQDAPARARGPGRSRPRAAGVATPALEWAGLRDYRDYMVRHLDDTAQISGYEQAGATVIKAPARITGPGQVEAAGRLLQAGHIVIATGSQPTRPAIDGLDGTEVWTNREATTVRDIPGRVLLIGGSAVGVELGQFYARMGAQVTIVQRAGRLIDREDPRVGELAAQALAADGITIRTGTTPT